MSHRMTRQNGNAMPLILGILLIAAIGVTGWLYLKSKTPDQMASQTVEDALDENVPAMDATTAPQAQDETLPEDKPPMVDDAMETTPDASPEVTDTTTPATSASQPVTIDVEKAMSTRSVGDANAPIKIIEYASLTCSHCAHFHNDIYPELKAKYIDTGKVYFEFREFPLNDPALKATLTARCLPAEKYEGFVSLLFKTQDHWASGLNYIAALKQNAKLAGMSDETFDACHDSSALKLAVADVMQKGQDQWKISATPTFIINNGAETISGAVPLTEFERVFRKVSGDAIGEAPAVE